MFSFICTAVTTVLFGGLSTASAVEQVADSSGGNITIDTSTYAPGDSLLVIGSNTVTSTASLGTSNPGGNFTGDVNINGGTLKLDGFYFGFTDPTPLGNLDVVRNINVNAGGTLLNAGESLTGYANAQIAAVLNINGGTVINNSPLSASYSYLTLNPVNFVNGGTLSAQGGNDLGNIVLNGTVSVTGTAAATISSSAPANIVALSDAGPNPAYSSGWTPNAGGVTTFNVGSTTSGGADLTVSAVLGDGWGSQACLTKTGSGIMALTAANNYTGNTTVAAGTLVVSNTSGSATGTGSVSVGNGAVLSGTGIISPNASANLVVQSGGTLKPGYLSNTPSVAASPLTVDLTSGATATFSNGSIIQLTLGTPGVAGVSDLLEFNGNQSQVAFNGTTLRFDFATGTSYADLTAGSKYNLIGFNSTAISTNGLLIDSFFQSDLTAAHPGLIAQLGLNNNYIQLDIVPEPSTYVLFGFGLISLAFLHRLNRPDKKGRNSES